MTDIGLIGCKNLHRGQRLWLVLPHFNMLVLIWIHTVRHSDGIPERILQKVGFEKKNHLTANKHNKRNMMTKDQARETHFHSFTTQTQAVVTYSDNLLPLHRVSSSIK